MKRIGQIMVLSVLCYGPEIWTGNADQKRRIAAVKMENLR